MAISHIKSDTIANWTGTVTLFDSQGSTATAAATDLVRPQDWNSAHNQFFTLGGNTTQGSTASGSNVIFAASGGALIGGTSDTVIVSVPVLSAWQPYPLFTGSGDSSHAPASWWFNKQVLPAPLSLEALHFHNSFSVNVPAATSQASTGTARVTYSKGVTIFKRVDFGASSTRFTTVTTASFGLTAGLSYSSTSQSFVMSWVTDTTGGTSSFTTTSSNAAWSSYLTGRKNIVMPLVTSLSEGEYFFAHKHSTTTGTTQSNVTLLNFSQFHIAPQNITMGVLSTNASQATLNVFGHGEGVASAVTTTSTMAISVVSQATRHWIYFHAIA